MKYKATSEKFRIIQFGLCTWNKVEGSDVWITKPFNIYTFPEEYTGNIFINCETSALLFNKDHGMDFNKWIYKGNFG